MKMLPEGEKDDQAMTFEMGERLRVYRAALKLRKPHPEKPDINTVAYMVATEISEKHTFGKILPEIVANQDALRPDVRRYLIKCLRNRAEARRKAAERELEAAKHWDDLADEFEVAKN